MEQRIWHKVYSQGVPVNIDYNEITMPQALENSVKNYPDNIALDMMGKQISYKYLNELVDRFAKGLSELGIDKGDKVAIILPNIPQIVISCYAAFKLGAVVVMNNPLYTERELENQLNDSDSKIAICLDLIVPKLLAIKNKTKIELIISCHINDFLPFPKKQLFPFVKRDLFRNTLKDKGVIEFLNIIKQYVSKPPKINVMIDDLCALLYTGGTTGISKGVMLSHKNISSNIQQIASWMTDMKDGDIILGIFPFFHSAGFTAIMCHGIYRAFTIPLIPRPESGIILEMIRKHKPTWLPCVPTLYVGIIDHPDFEKTDFSSIKGCLSGAAPLPVETLRQWQKKVGATIVEVYGLTESSPIAHANPWDNTIVGSVGVPLPDTDCRIVDVETGTKTLGIGESGEILIKGPQIMQGYYKRKEATYEVIKDGWFYTGDIGYMDENGYLFIIDRKKDMIIAGGYNIYPRDIDEVLYEHPKIQEACVIGIPDKYRGETVKAYIVVKQGQELNKDELTAYCKDKLAAYKVPKQFEFIEDLPKSAVGKVLRRELRDIELKK